MWLSGRDRGVNRAQAEVVSGAPRTWGRGVGSGVFVAAATSVLPEARGRTGSPRRARRTRPRHAGAIHQEDTATNLFTIIWHGLVDAGRFIKNNRGTLATIGALLTCASEQLLSGAVARLQGPA